jgi:hypothetical protein
MYMYASSPEVRRGELKEEKQILIEYVGVKLELR